MAGKLKDGTMEIMINIARFLMAGWIVYALLLIFLPSVVHQVPDKTSGIVQFIIAYSIGFLLDRLLGLLRRRRAASLAVAEPADPGAI
jgi:hypothetical protein